MLAKGDQMRFFIIPFIIILSANASTDHRLARCTTRNGQYNVAVDAIQDGKNLKSAWTLVASVTDQSGWIYGAYPVNETLEFLGIHSQIRLHFVDRLTHGKIFDLRGPSPSFQNISVRAIHGQLPKIDDTNVSCSILRFQ
jgi:hypothetical protein